MSDCHEALDCPDTLTELELAPEIEEGGGASLAYALNPGDVETGER